MMVPVRPDTAGAERRAGRHDGGGRPTRAFRLAAAVTLLGALHAAVPSVLDVMRWDTAPVAGFLPGRSPGILAMHAAGPRLALAASVAIAIRLRSPIALTALGAVLALVHALDAAACAVTHGIAWAAFPLASAALQVGVLATLDLDAAGRPSARRMGHDRA